MSNLMSDKDHLRSFFYDTAEKLKVRLHTWNTYGQNKTPFFTWIRQEIPLDSGVKTFLDAGCGTGQLLLEAAKVVPDMRLYGIDLSSAMVKETLGRLPGGANVTVGDVEELPFPDCQFDAVTAIHMLYHVPNQVRALAELVRVTKKGGKLFITTTEYDVSSGLNKLHYEGLKKYDFPAFMQDTNSYLRFTPQKARAFLIDLPVHSEECTYTNDVRFPTVESALQYYQSAMMYRQSFGIDDSRIKQEKWELLFKHVRRLVSDSIEKNGFFLMPATVVAFKIHK